MICTKFARHVQLYSYRHNMYKAGGKLKKNLMDQDLMSLLPNDKKDDLFRAIGLSFKNLKFNDYAFKVLIPEAILYLFAKLEGISRIKAEVLISSYSLERTNEQLNEYSDEDDFEETNIAVKVVELLASCSWLFFSDACCY
ncbi:uncharacterized protein LOC105846121 [Hydra vulgaris]|uniref:uncharacterized protein LOC105846121 n=1 Tax=Hydra vulgaris TaxID=6087 RepID=UPI001F5ECA3F|nr:uncharacterized protein LOC105846121 isoform X2 [Hydra vulgaris]